MKSWKQTWYSAVILTLLLLLWKNSVESKDVVYPKKEPPKRDNNEKTYADTKHRQVNDNLKKMDLFSLENTNRSSSIQETFPARKRLNKHKTLEHREMLDGEDINSSRSVECFNIQDRKVDNHISKAQKDRDQRNAITHFEDLRSDRPLKRYKRQPRPRPVGPSSEPQGSLEGEAERSSGVPEATTQPTSEPEISWPEPEPDWPEAFAKWKDAWPLHTYGFAAVFTIIALIPLLELLRMHLDKTKITALKSSLLATIFIFSSTRALALFVDPYGSANRFHLIITQLLFSLGHPCIISALSLLLLVLIDTTKMNIAPPKFQRIKFIVPVVISHVALVIVTDFVVVYFLEAKILLLMCQIYFLSLGILLAVGYARVGWKIRTNIRANVNSKSAVDNSMRRLQYLIAACAVASAFMSALTIYGAAGVFGIYSDVRHVNPWPWWIFQTSSRILETTICTVVLLMNTKASTKRKIFPTAHSFMTKSLFQTRRNTMKAKTTTPKETAGCQSIISLE